MKYEGIDGYRKLIQIQHAITSSLVTSFNNRFFKKSNAMQRSKERDVSKKSANEEMEACLRNLFKPDARSRSGKDAQGHPDTLSHSYELSSFSVSRINGAIDVYKKEITEVILKQKQRKILVYGVGFGVMAPVFYALVFNKGALDSLRWVFCMVASTALAWCYRKYTCKLNKSGKLNELEQEGEAIKNDIDKFLGYYTAADKFDSKPEKSVAPLNTMEVIRHLICLRNEQMQSESIKMDASQQHEFKVESTLENRTKPTSAGAWSKRPAAPLGKSSDSRAAT